MPSKPTPDSNGFLTLQADDASWHRVWLIAEEGIRPDVEQEAVADPGTRGYVIMTVADATKHQVAIRLEEDGKYRLTVEQDASAEASDYTSLLLGLNPTDGFRYAVTVIDEESYRLDTDDTPLEPEAEEVPPTPEPAREIFGGSVLPMSPRRRRKPMASVPFVAPTVRVMSGQFVVSVEVAAKADSITVRRSGFTVSCGCTMWIRSSRLVLGGHRFSAKAIHNPSDEELALCLLGD